MLTSERLAAVRQHLIATASLGGASTLLGTGGLSCARASLVARPLELAA